MTDDREIHTLDIVDGQRRITHPHVDHVNCNFDAYVVRDWSRPMSDRSWEFSWTEDLNQQGGGYWSGEDVTNVEREEMPG